ncbi:MAG: hypothetical protein Q9224_001937 [Gallowayella concinna]
MSEMQEMTFSDVAEHSSKKDLFIVVHDKIYDATQFVDEHPGGEEVLLDVGGQDATEAFEDVGHSDEARQILDGMEKAKLKRVVNASPPPPSSLFLPIFLSSTFLLSPQPPLRHGKALSPLFAHV